MGITFDANFRQVNDGYISTIAIDNVPPFSSHFEPYTPAIDSRIWVWFFRNKVSVINDDGDPGQFEEFLWEYSRACRAPAELCNASGTSPSGKGKPDTWFIRHNGPYI